MAGKLKNAPRVTKSKPTKPRGIAGIKTVEEITEAEREGVLAKLVAEHYGTARSSASLGSGDAAAEDLWRTRLLLNESMDTTLICGTRMVAIHDGIRVECAGRLSLLTWSDLVEYCCALFITEEEEADGANPRHVGDILNTTTPGGIEALDPDAEPAITPKPVVIDKFDHRSDVIAVNIAHLDPNPFQPRVDFDDAELAALAQSIAETGLAHPLLVRVVDDRYQVADGERRWRALKQLGWQVVPALVRTFTDQQMAEVAIATAEQRAGLNPIEKARHFERLQREFGYSQDALGQRFGITQGQVSHTLRLLRLPAKIQDLIMSRAIPQSHARLLVPFAEAHDDFWAALTKVAKLGTAPIPPLEEWPEVIQDAGEPWKFDIDGKPWCHKCCTSLELKPTDEERADLALVDVDGRKVATNRGAFKKLEARARRDYLKDHPEKTAKAKSKPGQKAQPAKKGAKAIEKGCTAGMLADWVKSWRCWLVSESLRALNPATDQLKWQRFVTYAIIFHNWEIEFRTALGLKGQSYGQEIVDAVKIASMPRAKLDDSLHKSVLAGFGFNVKSGPASALRYCRDAELAGLTTVLEIDLSAAWKQQQGGPLTNAYLELHSREQLAELMRECEQIPPPPSTAKKEFVARLVKSSAFQQRLPRELQEVIAPPKAASKKKGGKNGKRS